MQILPRAILPSPSPNLSVRGGSSVSHSQVLTVTFSGKRECKQGQPLALNTHSTYWGRLSSAATRGTEIVGSELVGSDHVAIETT